jgi:hypothetical protein
MCNHAANDRFTNAIAPVDGGSSAAAFSGTGE